MKFDILKSAYIAQNNEYVIEIENQFLTDESIEDTKFYNVRIEAKNEWSSLLIGEISDLSEYIIDFDLGDVVEEHQFDTKI